MPVGPTINDRMFDWKWLTSVDSINVCRTKEVKLIKWTESTGTVWLQGKRLNVQAPYEAIPHKYWESSHTSIPNK